MNCAVSTDRTRSQWVDLGIHTEACMTRPETCGAAGGAINFWIRLIDCPDEGGVISSLDRLPVHISLRIECGYNDDIWYDILLCYR